MEILVYFLIFMMGAFMGSFASLAVYRIPIGQDILIKHSYCPNCNAKLTTIDLIPIFSYLFLKGKCRHCHQKIRIRYLILEIFSGLAFLTFILSMKINLLQITLIDILTIAFGTVYILTLILISAIDKERRNVQKSLLIFGFALSTIYALLNYFIIINTKMQIAYLTLAIIQMACIIFITKHKQLNYIMQNIMLLVLIMIMTKIDLLILTIVLSLIIL